MSSQIEDCWLVMFRQRSLPQLIWPHPVTEDAARFVCSDERTKGARWFVGWTRDKGVLKRVQDNGTIATMLEEWRQQRGAAAIHDLHSDG